jgi:hypothetical protein
LSLATSNINRFDGKQRPIGKTKTITLTSFMPLVILHHLLNVFVQLANKRGFTKKQKKNKKNKKMFTSVTEHEIQDLQR